MPIYLRTNSQIGPVKKPKKVLKAKWNKYAKKKYKNSLVLDQPPEPDTAYQMVWISPHPQHAAVVVWLMSVTGRVYLAYWRDCSEKRI